MVMEREKRQRKHDLLLRLVKVTNVVLMTVPFAMAWMWYYAERTDSPYFAKGNYLIIAIFFVLYIVYSHIYDGFLISLCKVSEIVYSQSLAALIADAIMYIITWLLTKHLPAVWPLLLTFCMQILISSIWASLAKGWYFARFPAKKTLVVYDDRSGMDELVKEYGLDGKFAVQKVINIEECINGRFRAMEGMEAVFMCGIHSHDRNMLLKYCVAEGIESYVIPRIGDVLMSSAKQVHMFHLPILSVHRYAPRIEYVLAKRAFDIAVSGIGLVIISPIMLLTAIAIKVYDKGPVFYKQCRLTKNGKTFDVLKFRSMRVDAEKDGVARLSTGDKDDRITPIGRFIRKTRIDELPQFINILKGDMSIVGPRPERPEIAAQYEKELPEFRLRLQAKAGLTGYAQVYGKYNTTPYDKLQMDLMYIAKPSFLEDLRIIFATVKILFIPESTEGVAEGQMTASTAEMKDKNENIIVGTVVANESGESA